MITTQDGVMIVRLIDSTPRQIQIYMKSISELEKSTVVANSRMNRERSLRGVNSYAKELHFDIEHYAQAKLANNNSFSWLDVCCGEAIALNEFVSRADFGSNSINVFGIDLVGKPYGRNNASVSLIEGSFYDWETTHRFDLITFVHGMHYLGDKLAAIDKALSYLNPRGLLICNLDLSEFKGLEGRQYASTVGKGFAQSGLSYNKNTRILRGVSPVKLDFWYDFIGADDQRGPNYTRQESVDSYYRIKLNH